MTATNHALAGATIGLFIAQPIVALPLAFASHFMLDAVPHFGLDDYGGHKKNRKLFHKILYFDALFLSIILLSLLIMNAPLIVFICVFLAGSPDFVWAYRYLLKEKGGKLGSPKMSLFSKFHSKIQKSQTIRGLYIEGLFATLLIYIIVNNF